MDIPSGTRATETSFMTACEFGKPILVGMGRQPACTHNRQHRLTSALSYGHIIDQEHSTHQCWGPWSLGPTRGPMFFRATPSGFMHCPKMLSLSKGLSCGP